MYILPSSTGCEVSEEQSQEKSCPRAGLVGTVSGLCHSVLWTSRKPRHALHTMFLPGNEKNGAWQENILSLNKNTAALLSAQPQDTAPQGTTYPVCRRRGQSLFSGWSPRTSKFLNITLGDFFLIWHQKQKEWKQKQTRVTTSNYFLCIAKQMGENIYKSYIWLTD